jgi:ribulose-phosphate 3-epimerase
MVKISASAMCFDWKNVGFQLRELEEAQIDYLHFDLIDGVFAPDFGFGSSVINSIRETCSIPAEYHLMVENPSRILSTLQIRSEDIITIHQEACKNLHRDILQIKRLGAKAGVALNPGTHVNTLDYVIEELDHALIMTVNPGFKGQDLVNSAVAKILDLNKMVESLDLNISIGVDGNVNPSTIPAMVRNGANYLVGGSSGLFVPDQQIGLSLSRMKEAIRSVK